MSVRRLRFEEYWAKDGRDRGTPRIHGVATSNDISLEVSVWPAQDRPMPPRDRRDVFEAIVAGLNEHDHMSADHVAKAIRSAVASRVSCDAIRAVITWTPKQEP